MKRILTFLIMAAAALTMISCNQTKTRKALLPNISGKAGEVIVVIDKGYWEGAMGTVLRETLARDCDFLPQREPLFNLVDLAPSAFNSTNMFQIHRNIIIVNISSSVVEPGVVFLKDQWAAPQCVIRINAIDSESAIQLFKDNSLKIETTLEQAERDRIIANSKKYEERRLAPVVTELAGGSPHFPSGYKFKKVTDDFIWLTYETQYVTQGIFVYKYPVVEGENMMDLDNIISNTDKMLKNNVPGMFENTYMMTSTFARPGIQYMKYKGLDFASVHGFWEVYNDYMGGPFVSHVLYSKDGKDMIVLQGWVYAPKYDKRQYMRQVESIIYSFEWAPEENEE